MKNEIFVESKLGNVQILLYNTNKRDLLLNLIKSNYSYLLKPHNILVNCYGQK